MPLVQCRECLFPAQEQGYPVETIQMHNCVLEMSLATERTFMSCSLWRPLFLQEIRAFLQLHCVSLSTWGGLYHKGR